MSDRAAFSAISRVLKKGAHEVARSQVWDRIHDETGCGHRKGRMLTFSQEDLERLRRYAKSQQGIDPLLDSIPDNRVDAASKTRNEKFTGSAVFSDLIVGATPGRTAIPLKQGELEAPPGVLVNFSLEDLNRDALSQRSVLVVENGAVMPHCHELALPQRWGEAIVLYRGHGDNFGKVQSIQKTQPAQNLACFYDFDPAGLYMALSQRGSVIIPRDPLTLCREQSGNGALNQRQTFRKQHDYMTHLESLTAGTQWEDLIQTLKAHEIAIMQEHIIAHRIHLHACSGLS